VWFHHSFCARREREIQRDGIHACVLKIMLSTAKKEQTLGYFQIFKTSFRFDYGTRERERRKGEGREREGERERQR
jgi:hypothetical protein